MVNFALVVAATEELGIGIRGGLPWRLPKDMAFFKHVTTHVPTPTTTSATAVHGTQQNAVIMGRVTWESIPPKFRPLPDRFNLIVSRNTAYNLNLDKDTVSSNVKLVSSLDEALGSVDPDRHPRVFVIGGAQIYRLAIERPECTHLVVTRIRSKIECDAFFPKIDTNIYRMATHEELEAFVQKEIPAGPQIHKDIEYEFTLYIRR
ncbi:dihydrofolate reductase [Apophysomyces ossiformis]|uniref:Dihydrofolate reductase n=1 Tax=Apophysomyces ossiformis TaxID=679940 RepID=A0A8H7EM27_9FUNG|nr:dihydrofolate reductase [Apophysomyces ossiformis]